MLVLTVMCVVSIRTKITAQTNTTGSIEGIVTDSNNAVIPDIVVTATSPNLMGTLSSTTDRDGRYRFLNLPPGNYSISIGAQKGFGAFTRSGVVVNLSKLSFEAIQLEVAAAQEILNVNTSGGGSVALADNTSGSRVSTEQFSNLTTQRTVQSIYTIAPSVTRSGLRDASGRDRDPSVAGSSGLENSYILDGVNTTDPGWGGSGANLPFEFVQEVEIKTGAYGAEYGMSTGGIFNVLTKSGGNDLHGDVFAYFTTKSLVRSTKFFPFTGSAPNGFSEIDAGFDLGGAIKKDKLWFFGAFNPQRRENFYFTQTFRQSASNKVTTPFYAGKLSYSPNQSNVVTFSTFGDFTTIDGFRVMMAGAQGPAMSGFGADPNSFLAHGEMGGDNYAVRLNSTFTPTWIAEFSFGLHKQRNNLIPTANITEIEAITDQFAVVRDGGVIPVTDTNINFGGTTGFLGFVDGRGGSLQRGFVRQGFAGRITQQNRNRYEAHAKLQNNFGPHTLKYGFEFAQLRLKIDSQFTGPTRNFGGGVVFNNFNVANRFGVCTVQSSTIVCPVSTLTSRVSALIAAGQAPAGLTSVITNTGLTAAQISTNPFLIRSTTAVSSVQDSSGNDFVTNSVESVYLQDDFRITRDLQLNAGLRWDYQQLRGTKTTLLTLNNFYNNMAPRLGFIWDFSGKGKGKIYVNYAKFIEAPMFTSFIFANGEVASSASGLVDRVNAPNGSLMIRNDGTCCVATPIDTDLKPQNVNETAAGIEYTPAREFVLGLRGVYRAQGTVIEDGSFNEGLTYFVFNPGESETEDASCATAFGCFGRARRYYRALEFTATERFTANYQFIASYVYSSLTGNYEGFYRNDTGQALANISSLFDLQSLLANFYGRLPNDRPHQLKIDGSYRTRWKVMFSGSFRAQSGIPFNSLIPHPLYGDNEGFAVPRGTAINPLTGKNRTPTTYNLDLGGHYPIRLNENNHLRIQVDWFNVLNAQRAIRQDETVRVNSGFGVPGANSVQFPNPFYGEGTVFQYPSSLRLGIKWQF